MINKPKALMLASVASMIDLFNSDNINILLDLGYQVDVAANFKFGSITSQERVNEYRKELVDRGINVYDVPIPRNLSKVKNILLSYKIIKKLVEEEQYHLVHCHSPIGGVLCRLACRHARKLYGTKVIYTAHGFHFFKGASVKSWIIFFLVEKYCSRFTDVLITINKEDYRNACNFHAKKTVYIPGIGIKTEKFKKSNANRKKIRLEFGFNDHDFVFMSTGQLSKRKNHETIIRALAKIDNNNVKYLIVGFGELEEKLRKITDELNLNKRVIFAGYRSDINDILHSVDAYAFPSLQEGLPVALMEAMAVGLPVVCSNIRGNIDLIVNGKGGYLYDCYDIDGFADGMKKIISGNKELMKSINIDTIEKFDSSIVNKKMKKIYIEN